MGPGKNKLTSTVKRHVPRGSSSLLLKREWVKPETTSSELNGILADFLTLKYVQYGVNLLEHGDWVHTGYTIIKYSEGKAVLPIIDYPRPLNSWTIKNPIAFIPLEDDLQKIAEWQRFIIFQEKGKSARYPTSTDIREKYIIDAITQLNICEMFLADWRSAKYPAEQNECNPLACEDVRRAIASQKKNVNVARITLQKISTSLAPELLQDSCEAAVAEEEGIYEQLKIALRYAK